MVIRTTLKANCEADISYWDIITYVEECFTIVANLFDNSEKYYREQYEDTDFDKLSEDYTERQIASVCLKHLRSLTKGKDAYIMIWDKYFIELDCDGEIAYNQLEELIKEGHITNSRHLYDISAKAKRKHCTIHKGVYYGENDNYFKFLTIQDLVDKHFPCYADLNDTYCNNCGNCQ